MKSTVVCDEFSETSLKPSDLLDEYIRLVEGDMKDFFQDKKLSDFPCPACNSKNKITAFDKFGLSYVECADCNTLYVNPRPSDLDLRSYYLESKAANFWRNQLSKSTEEERLNKVIRPRVQWLIESTQEYLPSAQHWVDINPTQPGQAAEMAISFFDRKTIVSPFFQSFDIAGLEMSDGEGLNEVDVVSLFDVANRTSDVSSLFEKMHGLLKKGGLCFITAILVSGFDLQVLWENAHNIYPPDRLNVFSVEGLKFLAKRYGFECLEFSTPGVFDVELVMKVLEQQPDLQLNRFVRYFMHHRDEEVKKRFQEFLQESLLSSYGRVILQKL